MTILFLTGKGVGLPLLITSHFDILIHADLFADAFPGSWPEEGRSEGDHCNTTEPGIHQTVIDPSCDDSPAWAAVN